MNPNGHITDETLELHALGRTDRNRDATAIDAHLLVCQQCRERFDAEREYVQGIRAALLKLALERRP